MRNTEKKLNNKHLNRFNDVLINVGIEPFMLTLSQLQGFFNRYANTCRSYTDMTSFSLTGKLLVPEDVTISDVLVDRLLYLQSITMPWCYAVVSFAESTNDVFGDLKILTYTDNAILFDDNAYIIPWFAGDNDYIFSLPLETEGVKVITRYGKMRPRSFDKNTTLYARKILNL